MTEAELETRALLRFEQLIGRSEQLRIQGLRFDELRELASLYRQHSASLARLRDRDSDPDLIRHLNGLCVRAYAFLYSSGDTQPGRPRPGWRRELPEALGRTWRVQALAWSLLILGTGLGWVLTVRDPSALYALLPTGFGYSVERVDRLWESPEARAEFLARDETALGRNALFGSALFTHNTRVGILSFATGILAGIPPVMLQLYNGLMVGGFSAIFLRDPWPIEFVAWLLPHAVPEFTAVTLCVAAGLMLGGAVAAPGRRTRREALARNATSALLLIGAAIPLFFLAALVESFVRESALGTLPRLSIAGLLAALLLAGLFAVYRLSRQAPVDTDWLLEVLGPQSREPGTGSARAGP